MLERAFKPYKNILDGRLCEVVNIYKMQYGLKPGRGTVDAVRRLIVVLRRLTEKFRDTKRSCFLYIC